jgi:uncharacterized protein (DUF58 family)
MKTFVRPLSGILLALVAAATARGADPAALLPRLSIPVETRDAGIVRKGEKIEAVFEVRNSGPAPLRISDARPSCGCTVATFDREIAPGKSGSVHATVETKNLSGAITKTITVVSNDPERPQVALTLKADVRP